MMYAAECQANPGKICASISGKCECPLPKPDKKVYRVLRVLEYIGDRDAIERSLAERGVKGQRILRDYCINEAIVGEYPELLGKKD